MIYKNRDWLLLKETVFLAQLRSFNVMTVLVTTGILAAASMQRTFLTNNKASEHVHHRLKSKCNINLISNRNRSIIQDAFAKLCETVEAWWLRIGQDMPALTSFSCRNIVTIALSLSVSQLGSGKFVLLDAIITGVCSDDGYHSIVSSTLSRSTNQVMVQRKWHILLNHRFLKANTLA